MKKVLITGANGFVGRHLVRTFADQGYEVFAGVRKGRNPFSSEKCLTIFLDYNDVSVLSVELARIRPDILIHCAGVTVSGRLADFHEGNVRPTQHLLEVLAELPLERFILISSLAARGPGEGAIDTPVSAYGRSKLAAERLVRASTVSWAIVRPTAVYGPGDKAFHPLFQWARRGIFPRLGSAERRLTFVHVSDLCALVLAQAQVHGNQLVYAWDGVVYSQREVTRVLRHVAQRSGWVIPISAFLFAASTGLLDLIVRRLLRLPWTYPPEKMKELLADDWGIASSESPKLKMRSIREGFQETMKSYFPELP